MQDYASLDRGIDVVSGDKMYRLYTADINRPKIQSILGEPFSGYTLYPAIGAYKGISEKSLVIDLFSDNTNLVRSVAQRIADTNSQDAVAMQYLPDTLEMVSGRKLAIVA